MPQLTFNWCIYLLIAIKLNHLSIPELEKEAAPIQLSYYSASFHFLAVDSEIVHNSEEVR